jgi:hypothetical protein
VAINHVFEAALELQRFCESQQYRFCFIGAVALQRWGDPRATQDADLTLLTGLGQEEHFISALIQCFRSRRPDAAQFALRNRVLLLFASNDVPLDIALGGLPFEERTIERSSSWQITSDTKITTCSAEDLVTNPALLEVFRFPICAYDVSVLCNQHSLITIHFFMSPLPDFCFSPITVH